MQEIIPPTKRGRGGARQGAGRPEGSRNEKTAAIARRALKDGISPIEVMLNNMRFWVEKTGAFEEKIMDILTNQELSIEDRKDLIKVLAQFVNARQSAQSCAVDAAPYCHQKLATLTVKPEGNTRNIKDITDQSSAKDAQDAWMAELARPTEMLPE